MSKIKTAVVTLFQEHQTVTSILTIIVSMMAISAWMTSDIKADIKQTNNRIDALFHYVLTKQCLDDQLNKMERNNNK